MYRTVVSVGLLLASASTARATSGSFSASDPDPAKSPRSFLDNCTARLAID
jgi:hypothetical protein